jgi:uncharacterized protein (DUF2141 family)
MFLNGAVAQAQDVEVIIKNVGPARGTLFVGLFDSEKTFLKKPVRGERVAAHEGSVRAVFKDVPAGEYAISVFHDANGNGKLDTNFIGIPKEGVGASNDAMGSFGPPSFQKAKFKCPSAGVVSVTMKYL